MFLHELSRKICSSLELSITDAQYGDAVDTAFGSNCCYCYLPLEKDRTAIEHLEGMNRFRLGLHIPGNVILACKRCNSEKRRDDQLHDLTLAEFGWESFLSHDTTRCETDCMSCRYWKMVRPDPTERTENMKNARQKITAFRSQYPASLQWSRDARTLLKDVVDSLYRGCQEFATNQIRTTVDKAYSSLSENVGRRGAL
jgi:hypothetical protein